MVRSGGSTGQFNQLLKVSVRIQHYIELSAKDTFSPTVFQLRFRNHLTSPWREPKEPIKTKLCVTNTALLLTSESWWPYRRQRCVDFKQVQHFLTFSQAGRYCAIGIRDDDLIEKQYVVLVTKTMADVNQLLHLLKTQLSTCENTPFTLQQHGLIDVMPSSAYMLTEPLGTEIRLRSLGCRTSPRVSSSFTTSLQTIDRKSQINHHFGSSDYSSVLTLQACECKPKRLPRIAMNEPKVSSEYKDQARKFSRQLVPITENNTNSRVDLNSVPEEPKITTYTRPSIVSEESSKRCQSVTTSLPVDLTAWEVDIKYVRYDPVLGNVIDDQGSVYLYTAHQISR